MRNLSRFVCILCFIFILSSCGSGESGNNNIKNPSAVNTGPTSIASGITADSLNRVLLAGHIKNGSVNNIFTLRYDIYGTLDTVFSGDGLVVLSSSNDNHSSSIAVDSFKRPIIAGYRNNGANNDIVVLRYNADGTPDTTFSGDGLAVYDSGKDDYATSVVIDSSDRVIVAGYKDNGINNDVVILRFNVYDGTLDTTFSSDGIVVYDSGDDDYATSVSVDSLNRVIVTGYKNSGANNDIFTLRYTSDGTPDTTFSGDGIQIWNGL